MLFTHHALLLHVVAAVNCPQLTVLAFIMYSLVNLRQRSTVPRLDSILSLKQGTGMEIMLIGPAPTIMHIHGCTLGDCERVCLQTASSTANHCH